MYKQIIKPALTRLGIHKVLSIKRYIDFITDFKKFKKISKSNTRLDIHWKNRYPCLNDRTGETHFDRHYIYHTGWAARILANTKPETHIDISSSLYFASIASAFVPFKFYDYRPAKIELKNLSSESADLLSLPFESKSIKSISCMHVIEHIGLGRYGDKLDPDGDLKGMSELQRVLAKNGILLFVVPVGKPQIMFNAHRIYSFDHVISSFPELKLKEFALIPENSINGEVLYNPTKSKIESERYGCGCFLFEREL
jgi:SAM-dependent methyltransferase